MRANVILATNKWHEKGKKREKLLQGKKTHHPNVRCVILFVSNSFKMTITSHFRENLSKH